MSKTLRTSGDYTITAGDGWNSGSGANSITLDSLSVSINGNLTVGGATSTISTTNTVVEDNILELNTGATANTNSAGIIVERGSTGNNAAILWKEDTDSFVLGTTTATAADKSSAITVAAGALEVAALTATTGTFSGAVTSGGATISGALTATSLTTNTIASNGSNAELSIQPSGTGDVLISALRINGTTLDSSDSTKITIAEAVDVTGNTSLGGTLGVTGTTTLSGSFQKAVHTFVATDAITSAEHAGRLLLLGEVGGNADVVLTLPDATGSGDVYELVVTVHMASNTYKIQAPDADNTITGQVQY